MPQSKGLPLGEKLRGRLLVARVGVGLGLDKTEFRIAIYNKVQNEVHSSIP